MLSIIFGFAKIHNIHFKAKYFPVIGSILGGVILSKLSPLFTSVSAISISKLTMVEDKSAVDVTVGRISAGDEKSAGDATTEEKLLAKVTASLKSAADVTTEEKFVPDITDDKTLADVVTASLKSAADVDMCEQTAADVATGEISAVIVSRTCEDSGCW